LAIKTPGVLSGCKDASGHFLSARQRPSEPDSPEGRSNGLLDANSGFTASVSGAGSYSFSFT